MRVTYIHPSSSHYDSIFTSPLMRGGGVQDIKIYHSRGGSIFGVLGGLLRKSLPFIKSIIAPEFGNFVQNMTDDVSRNIPLKKSMKANLLKSTKNLGKRIMRGAGRSKSTKKKKKTVKPKKKKKDSNNKSCHADIFTSNKYDF